MRPRRQPKHKDSEHRCRPKSFPTRPVNPKQFPSLAYERPIGSETVPPKPFVDGLLSTSWVWINRLAFYAWWIMTTEMVLWLRVTQHYWMINIRAVRAAVTIRILTSFPVWVWVILFEIISHMKYCLSVRDVNNWYSTSAHKNILGNSELNGCVFTLCYSCSNLHSSSIGVFWLSAPWSWHISHSSVVRFPLNNLMIVDFTCLQIIIFCLQWSI